MRIKKLLLISICFLHLLNNTSCTFAGRKTPWRIHETSGSSYRKLSTHERAERRKLRQQWAAIEEFNRKHQAPLETSSFEACLRLEDPKAQIFLLMLLMSSCGLQVNATPLPKQTALSPLSPSLASNSTLVSNSTFSITAPSPQATIETPLAYSLRSTPPLPFTDLYVGLPDTKTCKVASQDKTKRINRAKSSSISTLHPAPTGLEGGNKVGEKLPTDPSVPQHTLLRNGGIKIIQEFAQNQTCPSLSLITKELLQVECTDPYYGFESESEDRNKCLEHAPVITQAALIFSKDAFEKNDESKRLQKDLGIIVGEEHNSLYQYLYESLILKMSAAFGISNLVMEITPQDFAIIKSYNSDSIFSIKIPSKEWQYNFRKARLALSLGMKVIPADYPMPNLQAALYELFYKNCLRKLDEECEYEKLAFEVREPYFCQGMLKAKGGFVAIFGAIHASFIEEDCSELINNLYYIQLRKPITSFCFQWSLKCPDSINKRLRRVGAFAASKIYREMPIEDIINSQ